MWTAAISIDKAYDREFDYILRRVKKGKSYSYAVCESRNRLFAELAGEEKYGPEIEREIVKIVTDVVLIYFKARYIRNKLAKNDKEISDAMAILISSLVYFDVGIEAEILERLLKISGEYSVDGLFFFRMSELTDNWNELCGLSSSLLTVNPSDSDIMNLTAFLIDASEGKKNKILVNDGKKPSVINMTTKEKLFVHDLFSDERQNLISAVIGGFPKEVCLRGGGARIAGALERIVRTAKLPSKG